MKNRTSVSKFEEFLNILRSFREKGIIQEAQEGYLKYCY